jgi:hypothetical protein
MYPSSRITVDAAGERAATRDIGAASRRAAALISDKHGWAAHFINTMRPRGQPVPCEQCVSFLRWRIYL